MAISRPLLIALAAVVVVFAAVTAMRTFGGKDAAPPATQAASTAPSAATRNGSSTAQASGGEAHGTGGKTRRRERDPAGDGIPAQVGRALARRQVVVLFFRANGHDDRMTARAVRALRGTGAAVFTDTGGHIDRYARVVGGLPVTELPSTIVIDRERSARVVDGFADLGTLRQLVIDAR